MIGKTIEFEIDQIDNRGMTIGQTKISGVVVDVVLIDGTTHYMTKLPDDLIVFVWCKSVFKVK